MSRQLHQIVILTTHEVDAEGLMQIYRTAGSAVSRVSGAELSAGTAFKLAKTVELDDDINNPGQPLFTPQSIEAVFGPLAP